MKKNVEFYDELVKTIRDMQDRIDNLEKYTCILADHIEVLENKTSNRTTH